MPVTEGFVCWTEPIGTVGPCQYITNRLGCIDIAARAGSITKPADADLAQGNPLGTYDGINAYIYTVCPQVPAIPTTTTTVSPITLTLTASCIGSGINGTGRIVASAFSGGTGTYANIKIGNSLSNAAAATPVVLSGATSYTWNNLVNSTWFVILTDNAGNSNYAQVVVSCTNTTTTTTSTTSTTTAAPICTYNGGSAVVIYPITSTTTSTSTTSTTSTTTEGPTTTTTTTTTAGPTTTSSTTTTTTTAPAVTCNIYTVTSTDPTYGADINATNCDGTPFSDTGFFGTNDYCFQTGTISVSGGTWDLGLDCTPAPTTTTTSGPTSSTTTTTAASTNFLISDGYGAGSACSGLGGPYPNSVYAASSVWYDPGGPYVTRFFTDSSMTVGFAGGDLYYGDQYATFGTTLQIDNNGYVIGYYSC